MQATYTKHTDARMDFRKISKIEVEQAILQPYFNIQSRLDRTIAVKKKGDKYLKVIYEKSKRQNNRCDSLLD